MLNRRSFVKSSLAVGSTVSLKAQTSSIPPSKGGRFLAGAAKTNITPTLGCAIAGNMTYTAASELHDELHVRSFVLDNRQTKLAFAVVDSCMVPGDLILRAKELIHQHTAIPTGNILISATHTHSAPPATHLL